MMISSFQYHLCIQAEVSEGAPSKGGLELRGQADCDTHVNRKSLLNYYSQLSFVVGPYNDVVGRLRGSYPSRKIKGVNREHQLYPARAQGAY
jgi:hypothetical protein